ncbi:tail fiber domain-containing protein [Mesorhizobium caraganae]|uniref:tail fiber domain-containing protein n=1 Tax=Mesorhizobium caraganae TaxID=483206 RepID=UPI001AEEFF4A|nr:tail fiber domain-containing protein [Mesorhizobium caraganae]
MGSKAPAPPDPKETSASQTGTSVSTAIANAMLGNVNQNTPDGSLNYSQTGTYSYKDPYTGKSYDIPQFTATQTLSGIGQQTKDQTDQAQLNLGKIANNQSAFLNDYLGKPVDLNTATEDKIDELGRARLDPQFARQEETMRTNLINRGIREGSPAFTAAMSDFGQNKNDAYNSLYLNGRAQGAQEALAQRNQPLNEISALMSGSQVQQPNFVNTNMPTIPTTDVAGNINQNYNQRLQAWQQGQAGTNGILGGLFGLGSSLIMSDRRTKTDIREIGETKDGQPLYQYRYKGSPMMQIGLMAQDVQDRDPDAVVDIGGILHVDYDRALEGVA